METTTLGGREGEIIQYLSLHPHATHKDLMKHLHQDRGNLSKRVKRLREDGFIRSLGKVKHTRGEPGDQWGLSSRGIGYIMMTSDYSATKIKQVITTYKKIDSQTWMLYQIINALEEEGADSDQVMQAFYRNTALLISNQVKTAEALSMIKGLLNQILGKRTFKRVGRRVLTTLDGAEASRNALIVFEEALGKNEVVRLKKKFQFHIDNIKENGS